MENENTLGAKGESCPSCADNGLKPSRNNGSIQITVPGDFAADRAGNFTPAQENEIAQILAGQGNRSIHEPEAAPTEPFSKQAPPPLATMRPMAPEAPTIESSTEVPAGNFTLAQTDAAGVLPGGVFFAGNGLRGPMIPGAPGKWRGPIFIDPDLRDAWTLALPLSEAKKEVAKHATEDCEPWELYIRADGEHTEEIRIPRGSKARLTTAEMIAYAEFLARGFSSEEAASALLTERIKLQPPPKDDICLDAEILVWDELDGIDEDAVCPSPCELDSECFMSEATIKSTKGNEGGKVEIEEMPPEPVGIARTTMESGNSTRYQFHVTRAIVVEKTWKFRVIVKIFCATKPSTEVEEDF